MRIVQERFTYPQREFNVVGFEIDPVQDREIINEACMEALGHGGDPHDPAGQMRTEDVKLRKRYLGALAENLLVEHLKDTFQREAQVIKKPFETYEKHVDIEIHWNNGKITNLEVRSSFYYATYLRNVIGKHFKTLGPYATGRKPGETLKDFYLQGVLRQSFSTEQIHTFYFTGGAPGHWFTERGTIYSLGQGEAEYLALPMTNGMDTIGVIDEIRRHANGV